MKQRGFLNPALVWRFAFWTIAMCIGVAVLASVLAIWEFAGRDVLSWTVATCAVIGAGTLTFSWVNGLLYGRVAATSNRIVLQYEHAGHRP